MEGLARLADLGSFVFVGTFALATASALHDRQTGTVEGPLSKLAGVVLVFLHVLVPIPGMAVVAYAADALGAAHAAEAFALLAFPVGFAGAIVCFLGGIYTAEAIEAVLGLEPHERYTATDDATDDRDYTSTRTGRHTNRYDRTRPR